ncbi:MAG: tetratricopeptide repeat protein [Chloroflexota bacterium]|nr:tetratricopeptide repeat protein [Chloroflexota bacterium]
MPLEFCGACGRQPKLLDRFCRGCGEALDAGTCGADPIAEAESLAARGLLDEAIAAVQRAIGQRETPDLHIALSTLYLRRGGAAEARRALDRALALDPDCAVAHAYIGGMLFHAGRVAEAQERLDLAQTLAPDDLVVIIKRAEYWMRLGILDNARDELRRGLQTCGGAPQVRAMAEMMYASVEKKSRGSFVRKTMPLPSLKGIKHLFARHAEPVGATPRAEVEA